MSGDFEKALDKLNRELRDMPSDNPLRQARSRIQQQAFDNSVNKVIFQFLIRQQVVEKPYVV